VTERVGVNDGEVRTSVSWRAPFVSEILPASSLRRGSHFRACMAINYLAFEETTPERIFRAALIAGILFCMVTAGSNGAKALMDVTIFVTAAVGLIGE
jgi:hypothetical protein